MKLIVLFIGLLFGVAAFAHDEIATYSLVAKDVETELKQVVDSENSDPKVREFSAYILAKHYKTTKTGRFWVRELTKCEDLQREKIMANGSLKNMEDVKALARLRCEQGH